MFGVQLNDVVFTAFFVALNVGLIAQLLRSACQAEFLHFHITQHSILVMFFAMGTIHLTLALHHRV
jgi:hypothetical protein